MVVAPSFGGLGLGFEIKRNTIGNLKNYSSNIYTGHIIKWSGSVDGNDPYTSLLIKGLIGMSL